MKYKAFSILFISFFHYSHSQTNNISFSDTLNECQILLDPKSYQQSIILNGKECFELGPSVNPGDWVYRLWFLDNSTLQENPNNHILKMFEFH